MTVKEIQDVFTQIAIQSKESDKELKALEEKSAKSLRALDEKNAKELQKLKAETERLKAETERFKAEAERLKAETEKETREVKKMLKELGKQIGGLGKWFGSFTEGFAYPSLKSLLIEKFGAQIVMPHVEVSRKGGKNIEIDVLGYANGTLNQVEVVEIKSRVTLASVAQLDRIIQDFATFFPIHEGKTLIGFLAGVTIDPEAEALALAKGYYIASTANDIFQLKTPEDFVPSRFII